MVGRWYPLQSHCGPDAVVSGFHLGEGTTHRRRNRGFEIGRDFDLEAVGLKRGLFLCQTKAKQESEEGEFSK